MKREAMRQFAEHIRKVDPDDFNMGDWTMCLVGHLRRREGVSIFDSDPRVYFSKHFNVPMADTTEMTCGRLATPEDAYKMLTKYLDTGKVVWPSKKRELAL